MFDIRFLSPPVEGMEFIDFQNTQFSSELVTLLGQHIVYENEKPILKPSVEEELYTIINKYTGFDNIELELVDWGNLAVDVGYFSPNHILNSKLAEQYLPLKETTLNRWFASNKGKIFKGSIDYKTGKVDGSFKTLPVKLIINKDLSATFPQKYLDKYKVTVSQVLAGCVVHELGHVFGACMTLYETAHDNVILKSAIVGLKESERTEDKVIVIKDAAKLLEAYDKDDKEIVKLVENDNQNEYLIYFTKLLEQRNSKRSLSLGVPRMTAEVVADAYAVRMGFDKELIAALGILYTGGFIKILLGSFKTAVLLGVFAIFSTGGAIIYAGLGPFILLSWGILTIASYFDSAYSGDYNAGFRRYEDAVRQLIAKFKEDKSLNSTQKAELIKQLDQYLVTAKKLKPIFEDTAFYRLMGFIQAPKDFKYTELEHYTQALANHEINVLGEKLGQLSA